MKSYQSISKDSADLDLFPVIQRLEQRTLETQIYSVLYNEFHNIVFGLAGSSLIPRDVIFVGNLHRQNSRKLRAILFQNLSSL